MTQLVLGTAEFNKEGYAGKPCPSEQEIVRILNLAWEGGISLLDCADTYGTEHVEKYFSAFSLIYKSRKDKNAFYHYQPGEKRIPGLKFASVYDLDQARGLCEAIVPLNINKPVFNITSCVPYVRSVFDRGQLLKQGYSVRDCLSFVARHCIKGVIVGVNSTKELEEILTAWESIHAKQAR